MARQLVVVSGPDRGQAFDVPDVDPVLLGRGKDATARLNDPHVSRIHCALQIEDGQLVLTDKSSAGGSFINGKKVATRQGLQPGDTLRIGETTLRFETGDMAEQTTMAPTGRPGAKPAVSTQRLQDLVGQTLAHYQINAVIAKGQSGVVFKAHDTKENRDAAVKVLGPEFSQDEEEVQRFIRAIKTTLPLRHPNLITVYAAGKTGGHCWVAMEYVDGESLTQVIQRIGLAGMLDWRHALRVAVHIGRALDFAGQHHIIHRNITPQNILVQNSDKLTKLGDLMLAKALEGSHVEQITRPGELLGDVRYMSPERTYGKGNIDTRSDIYSLGATVYHLLTGKPPCEGGSLVETIMKIRDQEPTKPTKHQLSVPALFEGTVMKMLAKRPEQRFQTAAELLADLDRVAKFQGVTV